MSTETKDKVICYAIFGGLVGAPIAIILLWVLELALEMVQIFSRE